MRVHEKMQWEATNRNGLVAQYENEPRANERLGDWLDGWGDWIIIQSAGTELVENWTESKRYIGEEMTLIEYRRQQDAKEENNVE